MQQNIRDWLLESTFFAQYKEPPAIVSPAPPAESTTSHFGTSVAQSISCFANCAGSCRPSRRQNSTKSTRSAKLACVSSKSPRQTIASPGGLLLHAFSDDRGELLLFCEACSKWEQVYVSWQLSRQ